MLRDRSFLPPPLYMSKPKEQERERERTIQSARVLAIIVMMANDNYLDVTTLCWPRAPGSFGLASHVIVAAAIKMMMMMVALVVVVVASARAAMLLIIVKIIRNQCRRRRHKLVCYGKRLWNQHHELDKLMKGDLNSLLLLLLPQVATAAAAAASAGYQLHTRPARTKTIQEKSCLLEPAQCYLPFSISVWSGCSRVAAFWATDCRRRSVN